MGLISSVLLALRVQRNPSVLLLGRQGGRQGRHSHTGAGSSPLERGGKKRDRGGAARQRPWDEAGALAVDGWAVMTWQAGAGEEVRGAELAPARARA